MPEHGCRCLKSVRSWRGRSPTPQSQSSVWCVAFLLSSADKHPLAGRVVTLKLDDDGWGVQSGDEFHIQDWWDRIGTQVLADDMVYGKVNGLGYLVHDDEIRPVTSTRRNDMTITREELLKCSQEYLLWLLLLPEYHDQVLPLFVKPV